MNETSSPASPVGPANPVTPVTPVTPARPVPPPPPPPPTGSFLRRHAVTFKMGAILLLVLILLIPLAMISNLIDERQDRRNAAVQEITSTWGLPQSVFGPVLVLPYEYKVKAWKEEIVNGKRERMEVVETAVAHAFLLPADLAIEGTATPSKLHRGIYEAIVYTSDLQLKGRFTEPDYKGLGIDPASARWADARITLAVSDLRGVGDVMAMTLGGETASFAPGCGLSGFDSGVTAAFTNMAPGRPLDFTMSLSLKGSRGLLFAPVGQKTSVRLASSWPDPSFTGSFLPSERDVRPDGFEAAWETSWYGRGYPQQTTDQGKNYAFGIHAITPSLFGVNFLSMVDSYRMVERAAKYGVLFIALIFTAFFLFEILSALSIHPFQYTLVGAALCLFYLALLSLSEFIRFGYAYWIGAAASSLLILFYSMTVLRSGLRALIVALALAAIYLYLYVVLQLQDYSLLIGTAGLFVVLGLVMFVTRKIDWAGRE